MSKSVLWVAASAMLVAVPMPAQAENWKHLTSGSHARDGSYHHYIDGDSVERLGGKRRVWAETRYDKIQGTGLKQYTRSRQYKEFDCVGQTSADLKHLTYSGDKLVDSWNGSALHNPVYPGTNGEAHIRFVCSL